MEEVGVRGGWGGAAGAGGGMRLKGLAGSVVVSSVGQVGWKAICSTALQGGRPLLVYAGEGACTASVHQGDMLRVLRNVDGQGSAAEC